MSESQMSSHHPRHRKRNFRFRRTAVVVDEDPLADPQKPVPNLDAADRFETFYRAQSLVSSEQEWRRFITTLHKPLPITFRITTAASLAPTAAECLATGKKVALRLQLKTCQRTVALCSTVLTTVSTVS